MMKTMIGYLENQRKIMTKTMTRSEFIETYYHTEPKKFISNLKCTTTSVIFKWAEEQKLKSGGVILSHQLSRDTRWGTAIVSGPDSTIRPGDSLLMSARPVVYNFNIDGENLMNTSDASVLAIKRGNNLLTNKNTFLYSWLEDKEEVSPGGIVLMKKDSTKENEPRKCLVHAAGSETGLHKGDIALLAYKVSAYKIVIDGIEMHNGGFEEVICFWPKD
jgi:co-chaperonin GroES (HSP10)